VSTPTGALNELILRWNLAHGTATAGPNTGPAAAGFSDTFERILPERLSRARWCDQAGQPGQPPVSHEAG
jgi:hypothetical protein